MVDRLPEIKRGYSASSVQSIDLEVGNGKAALFYESSPKIGKVLDWASRKLDEVIQDVSYRRRDDRSLRSGERSLDEVDEKLRVLSTHLEDLADKSNRDDVSSSAKARRIQFGKLGKDFLEVTKRATDTRQLLRDAKTDALTSRVRAINPNATEGDVEMLLKDTASIDDVLRGNGARHQLEDIRERNRDIKRMIGSITELARMFEEMSIIINSQQELVNQAEHEISETHEVVKKGNKDLEIAKGLDRKWRQKKRRIIFVAIIVLLLIVVGIGLFVWSRIKGRQIIVLGDSPSPSPTASLSPKWNASQLFRTENIKF